MLSSMNTESEVSLCSKKQCERRALQKGHVPSEKLDLEFWVSFSPVLQLYLIHRYMLKITKLSTWMLLFIKYGKTAVLYEISVGSTLHLQQAAARS